MATQHPDNACAPWWKRDGSAYISTIDEIEELITLFSQLPIDEYMWDWEGKHVDEAVGEKIYAQAEKLLDKRPLGKELHLTYRIPAFEKEKLHRRMARAFMNILSLNDLAKEIGVHSPPVHEMFLPLTMSASQVIQVRRAFMKVAEYHSAVFNDNKKETSFPPETVCVTPLVEDTSSMFNIESILCPYWEVLQNENGISAVYGQRVFLARSDPALNTGMVPAVLAIKAALSTIAGLSERFGFPVYPVIGTGSLPFRGSVNPSYTEVFLEQYAGVRTYSIQSAFRYDYEMDKVIKALETIKKEAPLRDAQRISHEDKEKLMILSDALASYWRGTIEAIAPQINMISHFVPGRRERLQHIGLFGYNRGVGSVTLPRAITFTAALYSIGVPPELIATGRGLRHALKEGMIDLIDRTYPALRADLAHAGKYVNHENITLLAAEHEAFSDIKNDIASVEEYLGAHLGPQQPHHIVHRNLTSSLYHRLREEETDAKSIISDIEEAAKIRKSLG